MARTVALASGQFTLPALATSRRFGAISVRLTAPSSVTVTQPDGSTFLAFATDPAAPAGAVIVSDVSGSLQSDMPAGVWTVAVVGVVTATLTTS